MKDEGHVDDLRPPESSCLSGSTAPHPLKGGGAEEPDSPAFQISYGIFDSPLGRALAAATGRGLCMLGLGDDDAALEAELRADYPQAALLRDDAAIVSTAAALTDYLEGRGPCAELPLDAPGTPFQQRVWSALQAIPYGETRTYGQIAEALGMGRGAARAVGAACGANPVSLVIPCHRAVGSDGKLHGFRWSIERKRRLLELERRSGRA
jgi:O-6-methylguanine DNA methyltransferase